MLAAVLLILAMEAEPSSAAAPAATGAAWIAKPSGAEISRLYPSRALHDRLEGSALLKCVFTASGTLSDCEVASETPMGAGFGAAALMLAPRFRAAGTPKGTTLEGMAIRIPIVFRPPRY